MWEVPSKSSRDFRILNVVTVAEYPAELLKRNKATLNAKQQTQHGKEAWVLDISQVSWLGLKILK